MGPSIALWDAVEDTHLHVDHMPPQLHVGPSKAVLSQKEAMRELSSLLTEELVEHVVPPQLEALGVEVALEEADRLQHVEHRALPHPLRQRRELARLALADVHQPGRAHEVVVAGALARIDHDEVVRGKVVPLIGPHQVHELYRRVRSVLREEVYGVVSLAAGARWERKQRRPPLCTSSEESSTEITTLPARKR